MIGQLLDRRYQVTKILGVGGFGETYIALDTRRPGNPVCVVKHLKPALQDPRHFETAKRLFTSEAATLEQLGNHDQIPRLLAYFDENQEFFLVQEYIEGHPLSQELIPGQRWSESQVIQLLQSVLSVLEFVHNQGVIHRDIKPDNIIRRIADNKLVLVDFGAVKQIRATTLTTLGQPSATISIGTPGYMATEQAQGKPRYSSDIYALGVIAIQAITGLEPPQMLDDPNTGELIWRNAAPVSPGLANVLTKMVRYHFKDRYQTAAEAMLALSQITNTAAPDLSRGNQRGSTSVQHTVAVSPKPAPEPVSPRKIPQSAAVGDNAIRSRSFDPLPLIIGALVTAAAGTVAAMSMGILPNLFANKSKSASDTCMAIIAPSSNIRSEPTSTNIDNVITTVDKETKFAVTGRRTKGGWVEVKVDGQPTAWANSYVISNNTKLFSCLQAQGISQQIVDDSTLIAARPEPEPKPVITNTPKPIITNSPQPKTENPPVATPDPTPTEKPATTDTKSVVEKANEKYQSGDIQGAIGLLQKAIATGNATLKDAQNMLDTIKQWKQDWDKAETTFNEINKAVDEGRWNDVLAYKVKVPMPNIQYWRDRVQDLFNEASRRVAEENKTKTQPPRKAGKQEKVNNSLPPKSPQ